MDALELLLGRDSALKLVDPAPPEEALATMFRSAVRAPDHGRLRPWRFIVIRGEARAQFGELIAEALRRRQPDAPPEALARERDKALRAPVLVAVVAKVQDNGKIPAVEQILSAGAAAQNILLAAHALGYGAVWKTGAPAYDDFVKAELGLAPSDAIVGFLYIGTRSGGSLPLPRPAAGDYVVEWTRAG